MGKIFDRIDEHQREWIAKQALFFVGSAPLDGNGHVNVSPKGPIGTLRALDDHTVAYLDLTASGAETIAHVRQNGRIVVMFCSFERSPDVVRLHGRGRVVSVYDDEFARWSSYFEDNPAARSVVVVDVERVSSSCGFALPVAQGWDRRDLLTPNMERRGADGVVAYRRQKNRVSIDGLPASGLGNRVAPGS